MQPVCCITTSTVCRKNNTIINRHAMHSDHCFEHFSAFGAGGCTVADFKGFYRTGAPTDRRRVRSDDNNNICGAGTFDMQRAVLLYATGNSGE